MEPPGFEYLHTVSAISVTFAVTAALLTAVRQIKGGELSPADVHLVTTFMSAGFVACITALLPELFTLLTLSGRNLWVVASIVAALLHAAVIGRVQWERYKLSMHRAPPLVMLGFAGHWVTVLMLASNAVIQAQGIGLYAAAVTLSLGISMWLFVHRMGTLSRGQSDGDWDLRTK